MNNLIFMAINTSDLRSAGVNTLVGMGTVFIMLIFISLIISCFKLIPKIQKLFEKKSPVDEAVLNSIDNTVAQIVSSEEEEQDDLELVAVITASIMAYLGDEAPADGLVVRNIRRVR